MELEALVVPRQSAEIDQPAARGLRVRDQFLIVHLQHWVFEDATPVIHELAIDIVHAAYLSKVSCRVLPVQLRCCIRIRAAWITIPIYIW